MKYAFFGTPRFAAIILEELIAAKLPPALVITNPDRPAGRKKIMTAPPVKQLVARHKSQIAILQPENLNAIHDVLVALNSDIFVVAAYAKILPKKILNIPKIGSVGIHPSLLPKYRGASPIQSALLNGEGITGVTVYLLDELVDHGSILGQTQIAIRPETNYLELEETLARAGGRLLADILSRYAQGQIMPVPQNHAQATFTKKFRTEDGFVNLEKDAPEIIYRKIKALNPEPGVYTIINGIRTKLLDAKLIDDKTRITKIQEAGGIPKATKLIF